MLACFAGHSSDKEEQAREQDRAERGIKRGRKSKRDIYI